MLSDGKDGAHDPCRAPLHGKYCFANRPSPLDQGISQLWSSWTIRKGVTFPYWAKDEKIGYSTINARGEEVATKPAFKEAFRRRRCLVPADGFYEWKKLDAKTKRPYRITLGNGGPFAFAGLWERWTKGAEPLETFTIITTEPNELVRPLHNRMPVIIDPPDYETWLATQDLAAAQALLKPFPADRMKAYPVSSRVGNVKNNDPQLIEAVAL